MAYNFALAFVICAAAFVIGEVVSTLTKAWIPSVFVTAVVMLAVMLSSMVLLKNAKAETMAMEQYVAQLREENAALQNEHEAGYDIKEVERTALALGMIPAEQAQHITLEKNPAPAVQLEAEKPDTWDWIYTLLTGLFA